jgi:hypothetical protein
MIRAFRWIAAPKSNRWEGRPDKFNLHGANNARGATKPVSLRLS